MRTILRSRILGRSMYVLVIAAVVVICSGPIPSAQAQEGLAMSLVSTDTGRPHQVQAGTPTTFVVYLRNTGTLPLSVTVSISTALPGQQGWNGALFLADSLFRPISRGFIARSLTLQANQTVMLTAMLVAPVGLPDGVEGRAQVTATTSSSILGTLELPATVRNQPKLYFVSMDGCGGGYLYMDRRGNWDTGANERLMPRARAFTASAAFFPNAFVHLPAITDPNHVAALSGSWPGTTGLANVIKHYAGVDPETGEPVYLPINKDMLRWGANGAPVQTLYDVVQNGQSGATPNADLYHVMFSGKEFTARLFDDAQGTVDAIAGGLHHPWYLTVPQPRVLGDPPSDPDAATDRDGTNLEPPEEAKLYQDQSVLNLNQAPWAFPADRWLMDSSLRILFAEDPDVFYINLADCDDVQHEMGAADRPPEWIDPGTPEILWDDSSVFNPYVNRSAILDVVFEADFLFGRFLDSIGQKGLANKSIVTLLADHGQNTLVDQSPLHLGQILQQVGYTQEDVEMITAAGPIGYLYLTDPDLAEQVEASLESYTTVNPVNGNTINPFIVFTRTEMDSGIDNVVGPFGGDGIAGNRRGELYSEWNIEHPVTDFSKVRWPDLWIFNRERLRFVTQSDPSINSAMLDHYWAGSHGGPDSTWITLAMRGPGISNGVYTERVTLVDIAPTLYELLDLPQPAHVDGRVISSVLQP